MKERPILFSSPMVRAILDDRKTQTRRVVKKPEYFACLTGDCPHWDKKLCAEEMQLQSPYGQPGDRLWVRETWAQPFKRADTSPGCVYRADDDGLHMNPGWSPDGKGGGWKPSIFMPRWASRITLEVTDARVERLQEISEQDAEAEGVYTDPACPAYDSYRALWDQINGKRAAWLSNPWVWVIEFKRVLP